jgi:catechol 2,3-dioxygenase-like lactoylglutathione lyase family enzyme
LLTKSGHMRIRLHEIEMGAAEPGQTTDFFSSVLGLEVKLQENALTVFDSGIAGFDFNVSDHLLAGAVRISFLTDDLQRCIQVLEQKQLRFEGPYESHLGMLAVRFMAPNGIEVVVNTTTDSSPAWLKL